MFSIFRYGVMAGEKRDYECYTYNNILKKERAGVNACPYGLSNMKSMFRDPKPTP